MAHNRPPLERSTVEAYAGIVCGIFGAIVTSPLLKAVLLVVASTLLIHAVFRSSWTIRWSIWNKLAASLVAFGVSIFVGWEPLKIEFQKLDKATNRPQEPGLFIDCLRAQLPVKTPADGRLTVLGLFPIPAENGGDGKSEISVSPGIDYTFGYGSPFSDVYRCQVTNYGSDPEVEIDLGLSLVFQEVVIQPTGGLQSGKVTLVRIWHMPIAKIDPGLSNPFVFYIFNESYLFAQVSIPEQVAARKLGESSSRKIKVTHGNIYPLGFTPIARKQETVTSPLTSPIPLPPTRKRL
jgi:hypothetical protein